MEHLFAQIELYACEQIVRLNDMEVLCNLAKTYGCAATVVHPCFLQYTIKHTVGYDDVLNCAAIDIPSGCDLTSIKVYAAKQTELMGAQQINVMLNMSAFLSGNINYARQDIDAVCDSVKIPVFAVVEAGMLQDAELAAAIQLVNKTRVSGVQLCSGLLPQKATANAVKAVLDTKRETLLVKVVLPFDTPDEMLAVSNLGVTSIGLPVSAAQKLLPELSK